MNDNQQGTEELQELIHGIVAKAVLNYAKFTVYSYVDHLANVQHSSHLPIKQLADQAFINIPEQSHRLNVDVGNSTNLLISLAILPMVPSMNTSELASDVLSQVSQGVDAIYTTAISYWTEYLSKNTQLCMINQICPDIKLSELRLRDGLIKFTDEDKMGICAVFFIETKGVIKFYSGNASIRG